jgi:ABC-type antimicrobial peptide transport system permease subunit
VFLTIPLGTAIRAQLFHVQPSDPLVVASAAVAVVVAAILASVLPARRLARVDPALALRQD